MSWLSNILHGKSPLTPGKDPPLVRPPAGGPGTIPGQQQPFPIGDHRQPGGNIPQTTIPQVGVNAPQSGGNSMAGDGPSDADLEGFTDEAKNFLKQHWKDLLTAGISIAALREGMNNSAKSNALMDEGLNLAKQDYASRQPFRDAGMTNMLDPRTPDLSGLFANPSNPYARGRQIPVVGNRIPASATMPALQNSGNPSPPTQPVTQPIGIAPGYEGPTGTPSIPVLPRTNPKPRDRSTIGEL